MISGLVLGLNYYSKAYGPSEKDQDLYNNAQKIESSWDQTPAKEQPEKKKAIEKTDFKDGETIGIMTIPKFGKEWKVPIVQGTNKESLSKGLGHYGNSVLPHEKGNFAVAGHRSGDPQPFRNLLELKVGDKIIVETKTTTYTYEVKVPAEELTLDAATGGWVITSPKIDKFYEKNVITLTTCTRFYHSDDRSVLFGQLVKKVTK